MGLEKKIYLVGGAVRDQLLGYPISDKDYVAIGYSEEEFSHLQRVGKDFPVFLQEDGSELALARIEKKISYGYNGFEAQTKNVTLQDDLLRRDLTINSIAYDESLDQYIDPFHGKQDIKNKILRHTSSAFIEDPLRVLRLARFKAKLGEQWSIDVSTKKLVKSMKKGLLYLQSDRVYKELKKVFSDASSYIFFETLYKLEVIEYIFPTIAILLQDQKLWNITKKVLKLLENPSMALQLAVIYYQVSQITNDIILSDIQMPKKIQKYISLFVSNYNFINKIEDSDDIKIINFMMNLKDDKELLEDILKVNDLLVDVGVQYEWYEYTRLNNTLIQQLYDEISSYSPKDWIKSLATKPSNQEIISHLQDHNLQLLRRYKQLYTKLFIVKS